MLYKLTEQIFQSESEHHEQLRANGLYQKSSKQNFAFKIDDEATGSW